MANLIREEKFIKSDIKNNNNKWWNIEVYDNGDVITRWGRVGETGQSKTFPKGSVNNANIFADSKIKKKLSARNGEIPYTKALVISNSVASSSQIQNIAESQLSKIATKEIKFNNKIVEDLIKYLTKVNVHQITTATGGKISYSDTTGLFSTPLGIVTQDAIDKANEYLNQIADLIVNKKYDKNLISLTNSYLTLIPQDIGRHRLDINDFWKDDSKLKYQKGILDGLQTSYTNVITQSKSKDDNKVEEEKDIPKTFNLEMNLVEDGKIIDDLTKFYESTKKSQHSCYNYKVKCIYSVNIQEEFERFKKYGEKIGNIHRFFHGSSSSNLLSILKQGLIIPPASSPHVCGRAFSNGVYFAPCSSKSLNYSTGYWGQKTSDRVFMFIANVAMGKPYTPNGSSYSFKFPGNPYNSTWAKAGISGVINDECIVYNLSQCNLKYLLELSN